MAPDDDRVVLLTCGDLPPTTIGGTRAVAVPSRPARADVDPVLADPEVARLVVVGTDADLDAVLGRLLRTDRFHVELAYVPVDRRSAAARVWGLPHGDAALELARHGTARPAPLVRDDVGGVLVGRAEVRGVHGEVYCDAVLALRGAARRLVVTPWPRGASAASVDGAVGGIAVRAGAHGRAPDGRTRAVPADARTGRGAATGRAVQLGCLPTTLVHDGVEHPRPVTRWAWYRHTADWLLVRPDHG